MIGTIRHAAGWPSRTFGPSGPPLLITLFLFLASTSASGLMYLNRSTGVPLDPRQLNNYFAYYQDLPVAGLIIPMLMAVLAVKAPPLSRGGSGLPPMAVIAGVLAVGFAGTKLLFGGFGLSIDEFMADFDATILTRGQLFAEVPQPWRSLTDALQPTFLFRTTDATLWSSSYLPGNAAIRALFDLAGMRALASPALAALSAGLIYAIGRKLVPKDRGFAWAGLLLLATSSQFLITAMTPYAMTAHLALNLAWLWLVLHERRWSSVAALVISFLACGLHQAIFHVLFVAPFLPWLWFKRRRGAAAFFAIGTAGCALFWISYWPLALDLTSPGAQIAGQLRLPLLDRIEALFDKAFRISSLAHSADNLLRLLTWQNPLLWIGTVATLIAPRRLPAIGWALLGGILLTIIAMLLLMPAQGHGWGYRYLHGLLGSFALLGGWGWQRLRQAYGEERNPTGSLLVASAAVSLLVLLPLRLWQVDRFVRPYRIADARIAAIPADIVIIEHGGRWFANDLVRNDPFLRNRPLRMLWAGIPAGERMRICRRYRVRVLNWSSLELRPLPSTLDREFAGGAAQPPLHGMACR